MIRRLQTGEMVKDGDVMFYGDNCKVTVWRCKYDPGCCVGHIVEDHEHYERSEKEPVTPRNRRLV
jgi:hypothetical protein